MWTWRPRMTLIIPFTCITISQQFRTKHARLILLSLCGYSSLLFRLFLFICVRRQYKTANLVSQVAGVLVTLPTTKLLANFQLHTTPLFILIIFPQSSVHPARPLITIKLYFPIYIYFEPKLMKEKILF